MNKNIVASHVHQFLSFCFKTRIDCVIEYLYNNNPPKGSYHNTQHIFETAVIADYLFCTEGGWSDSDRKNLAVAALLHDFGHSCGVLPDSENVSIAVSNIPFTFSIDADVVADIIRCTEFPFVRDPKTLEEKCMRDADILYATLRDDPEVVMEHLRKEIEISKGYEISYDEMLAAQTNFILSVNMFTDEGRRLMSENSIKFLASLAVFAGKKRIDRMASTLLE